MREPYLFMSLLLHYSTVESFFSRGVCGCGCELGQSGLNQVDDSGVIIVHGDGEGSKAVVNSEAGVSTCRKQRTDHVNQP